MELIAKLPKKHRNNVFRSKETTKNAPTNIFIGFQGKKKATIDVFMAKSNMKHKCSISNFYKQRKKVSSVYLECKLKEDSYSWCLFK